MKPTLYEDRLRLWQRYVANIDKAVARYAASPSKPSIAAVAAFKEGLLRYARILQNAARACAPKQR